jgi:hypothetical protein
MSMTVPQVELPKSLQDELAQANSTHVRWEPTAREPTAENRVAWPGPCVPLSQPPAAGFSRLRRRRSRVHLLEGTSRRPG